MFRHVSQALSHINYHLVNYYHRNSSQTPISLRICVELKFLVGFFLTNSNARYGNSTTATGHRVFWSLYDFLLILISMWPILPFTSCRIELFLQNCLRTAAGPIIMMHSRDWLPWSFLAVSKPAYTLKHGRPGRHHCQRWISCEASVNHSRFRICPSSKERSDSIYQGPGTTDRLRESKSLRTRSKD